MPLSKPLLPAEYIRRVISDDSMQGFKSYAFDKDAHEFRVGTRNWIKPLSPDSIVFNKSISSFTYLHYYAKEGDVLALSEVISLGATPNHADNDGNTPLHVVFVEMMMVKDLLIMVVEANGFGLTETRRLYSRLSWVTHILVEQHANVNITIGSVSPLDLSCTWKDWDLITLLLKHGARPSPTTVTRFTSSVDKKRFSDLVKLAGPRPSRVCPCWSGKSVPDCHGKKSLPYPLDYMCVCGSTKIYQKCCHKRGKFVSEKWDDVTQRNLLSYDSVTPIPPRMQHKLAAHLLSKGLIDTAFGYAMSRTEFLPMPHGRTLSRSLREDMQTVWNQCIDDYIASGNDLRSKEEIERNAKIGSGNGALFRVCRGSCQKVEKGAEKFSLCGQCKATVYCSKVCQKASWPTHRVVCSSGKVREQLLPSQKAIEDCLNEAKEMLVISRLSENLNLSSQ